MALLPAAGDEREAILRTRQNLASMEKAEGATAQ
jgi:hypothetical protein